MIVTYVHLLFIVHVSCCCRENGLKWSPLVSPFPCTKFNTLTPLLHIGSKSNLVVYRLFGRDVAVEFLSLLWGGKHLYPPVVQHSQLAWLEEKSSESPHINKQLFHSVELSSSSDCLRVMSCCLVERRTNSLSW